MNLMPVIPLAKKEQRPWEWELNAESQSVQPPVSCLVIMYVKGKRWKVMFPTSLSNLFTGILHHCLQNSQGKEGSAGKG